MVVSAWAGSYFVQHPLTHPPVVRNSLATQSLRTKSAKKNYSTCRYIVSKTC
jgi:hypothetical protein